MAEDIKAGGAYIELGARLDSLRKGLARGRQMALDWANGLKDVGKGIAAFGGGLTAVFGVAARSAGNFLEVESKFGAVFGELTKENRKWSEDFGKEVGRSKTQVLGFMAEMQDTFVPFGFDRQSAADLSKTVTRLAVDLASFNNMSDEDALAALRSGLVGSHEALLKFGVIINEATLKQEALNRGFDPKNLTEQQKALLRLNLIIRGTKDAQGDATKTAGSFNNQIKALQAGLSDLAVAVGQAVIPAITEILGRAKAFVQFAQSWAENNKPLIESFFMMSVAITGVGIGLIALGVGITALLSPTVALTVAIAGIGMAVLAVTDTLGITKTGFGDLFNSIRVDGTGLGTWLSDFWLWVEKGWDRLVTSVSILWDGLWVGVKNIGRDGLRLLLFLPEKFLSTWRWAMEQAAKAVLILADAWNALPDSVASPIDTDTLRRNLDESVDRVRGFELGTKKVRADLNTAARTDEADQAARRDRAAVDLAARDRARRAERNDLFRNDPRDDSRGVSLDTTRLKDALAGIGQNILQGIGGGLDAIAGKLGIDTEALANALASNNAGIVEDLLAKAKGAGSTTGAPDFTIAGTFSGAAAASLGADGIARQQLDALKSIGTYSKQIADNTRDGGAARLG